MAKLDEVSKLLGKLDEKSDMLLSKVTDIEKHLNELNGTVTTHQIKMAGCDVKFVEMAKAIGSVKWDYKFWGAIAGLVVIVTAAMRYIGFG